MRPFKPAFLALLLIVLTLLSAAAFAAAKKYQVTGKLIELTDKVLVVQKSDGEKWELDRTADTKIDGELKVGAKVTIYYHMVADTGEVKKD